MLVILVKYRRLGYCVCMRATEHYLCFQGSLLQMKGDVVQNYNTLQGGVDNGHVAHVPGGFVAS